MTSSSTAHEHGRTAPTRRRTARCAAAGAVAVAAVAGGLFTGASAASAATGTPIVYSVKATASGTLDGVTFANALVTVKQYTNTADVTINNGQPSNRVGKVVVTVAGVGSDTLTYGTSYVSHGVSYPGGTSVFDVNGANSFNVRVSNPSFSTYNMDRPFGPVSGPTYVDPNRGAATSRGGLTLTSAGTGTFHAYIPRHG